jgi:hypothetical protein
MNGRGNLPVLRCLGFTIEDRGLGSAPGLVVRFKPAGHDQAYPASGSLAIEGG